MIKQTKLFGERIRDIRESAGLSLKAVSTKINIDTSLLAKIERNERQPTKQFIKLIADFYKIDENELKNDSLSDLIAYKVFDEEADMQVLKEAEEKVKYLRLVQDGKRD